MGIEPIIHESYKNIQLYYDKWTKSNDFFVVVIYSKAFNFHLAHLSISLSMFS